MFLQRKANNTLSFLCRNVAACPRDIKYICYKTLVRPWVEDASSAWDRGTKTNICKVEAVQRRAVRFCYGDYHRTSSMTSMLQDLHGQTYKPDASKPRLLWCRRSQIRRPQSFKQGTTHGAMRTSPWRPFVTSMPTSTRFTRLISTYGTASLPAEVTTAPSVEVFKTQIGTLLT